MADVSRSPVLLRRYGASPANEQGCAFAIFARCFWRRVLGSGHPGRQGETRPVDIFARCPGHGAVIQVGARSVRVLLGAAGSILPEGAHEIAGGAVPNGAALRAPATKSLPPPTPHGRGCRTSRPRP